MATVIAAGQSFSIASADTFIISGQKQGAATIILVDLRSVSFVGSITAKCRAAGSANTPLAISYRKHYLNGAVGDETFVSTAITTDSIIEFNAAGLDIVLDCTSFTSGSATVNVRLLTG